MDGRNTFGSTRTPKHNIIYVITIVLAVLTMVDVDYILHHSLLLLTQYALRRNVKPNVKVAWCTNNQESSKGNAFEFGIKNDKSTIHKRKGTDFNILLIITDDLGYNDLNGMGIHTKYIQSIAKDVNGIDFVRTYAGHATCSPSRASLLTGVYAPHFGYQYMPLTTAFAKLITYSNRNHTPMHNAFVNDRKNTMKNPALEDLAVPLDQPMLAEQLQYRFGYDTYMLGKWHLGLGEKHTPIARGYRESLIFPGGASLYAPLNDDSIVKGQINGSTFDNVIWKLLKYGVSHNNGDLFEPDAYMTDYLSDETANLIHTHKASTLTHAPWFITLAYNAVHDPLQARIRDFDSSEVIQATREYTQAQAHDHQTVDSNEILLYRVHAAMILALDRGIGRVLQALKDTNQYENTLIVFTSDNGGAANGVKHVNSPFRGWKATFFEGGLRVPLYMKLPISLTSIPMPPTTFEPLVLHIDLYPTILAAVDGKCNNHTNDTPHVENTIVNGLNLLPYLLNTRGDKREVTVDNYKINNTMKNHSSTYITNPETAQTIQHIPQASMLYYPHRPLYWISGHYEMILYRLYKLHITSSRVWLYNLKFDETENEDLICCNKSLNNYTELMTTYNKALNRIQNTSLNQTLNQLDILIDAAPGNVRDTSIIESIMLLLLHLSKHFQNSIPTPLWHSYVTVPIAVDKMHAVDCDQQDDVIYWTL